MENFVVQSTQKWRIIVIYNGILLSHKKEWNDAICSNMDGPRDYHTKWSKSERERQIIIWWHFFVKSKTNDTNELIYKTEIDPQA